MGPSARVFGFFFLYGAAAVGAALTTGCATTARPIAPSLTTEAASMAFAPLGPAAVIGPTGGVIPVTRYGRYTLVELAPEPAQRDLMQQAVEVVIPPNLDTSVGDAMRHVLLRSGYRLCDSAEASGLYALPLPAAHLRLGPLVLRDALLTLAGPAWDISVDDVARQVCFQRRLASANAAATPASAVLSMDQAALDETRRAHP